MSYYTQGAWHLVKLNNQANDEWKTQGAIPTLVLPAETALWAWKQCSYQGLHIQKGPVLGV